MREIHIHVEEPSMEAFLQGLLPRVLSNDVSWRIIDHGSKWQFLKHIPDRFAGYGRIPTLVRPRILALIDRDDDDCHSLKIVLEDACASAGLITKTASGTAKGFDVVNRIVVEELEAWFIGDLDAVAIGWPGVSPHIGARARYRDPDAVAGGTHEALLAILQNAGHLKGIARLPKIETARRMSDLTDPLRNRSRSFQQFLTGLHALVAVA